MWGVKLPQINLWPQSYPHPFQKKSEKDKPRNGLKFAAVHTKECTLEPGSMGGGFGVGKSIWF